MDSLITAAARALAAGARTESSNPSPSSSDDSADPRTTNGLALALREIGRIERSLFMLDWFELPGLPTGPRGIRVFVAHSLSPWRNAVKNGATAPDDELPR